MKRLALLLILLSTLLPKISLLAQGNLNLKGKPVTRQETNFYLAERNECVELMKQKNIRLRKCDSIRVERDKIDNNYVRQIEAGEFVKEILTSENDRLTATNKKLEAKNEREVRRKKIWRTVALVLSGTVAVVVSGLLL